MTALAWIRFQTAFGYGTTRGQKLLTRYGHPSAIFSMTGEELAREQVFTPVELRRIRENATEEAAQRVLETCRDRGYALLTPDDPEYPARLREIYGCPSVLYLRGSLGRLDEELAIAMVGTRKCTAYGARAAEELAGGLAAKGAVIVSGLARGIDTFCHTAALRAGGKTVAVLGCGLDVAYPPENAPLEELIVENGGAVVTEFQPGEKPLPFHFPVRNRVISGLANGTVVVEGGRHSGSLVTAGHALAQNRDVFAVPGSIFSEVSRGPNYLLQQCAKAADSVESILEEYRCLLRWEPAPTGGAGGERPPFDETGEIGYHGKERPSGNNGPAGGKPKEAGGVRRTLPGYLDDTQQRVYDALADGQVRTSDYIAARSGLPTPAVLAALTQMEIFGLVRTHPGRRFSLSG